MGFSITEVDNDAADEAGSTDAVTGVTTQVLDMGDGKKRVSLNTMAICEIRQATGLLCDYLVTEGLGQSILPHLTAIHAVVFPLVVFKFNEEVRGAAALCSAACITAALSPADGVQGGRASAAGAAVGAQLLETTMRVLLAGLGGEHKTEPKVTMCEAVKDVLEACFRSGGIDAATGKEKAPVVPMPLDQVRLITVELIGRGATESLQRRAKVIAEYGGEAFEGGDDETAAALEEELEPESELMTHVVDAIGYVKGDCCCCCGLEVLLRLSCCCYNYHARPVATTATTATPTPTPLPTTASSSSSSSSSCCCSSYY